MPSLLDQAPVLFPSDQNLFQELNQMLSVLPASGPAAGLVDCANVSAFLDIVDGLDQMRLLYLGLFGSIIVKDRQSVTSRASSVVGFRRFRVERL